MRLYCCFIHKVAALQNENLKTCNICKIKVSRWEIFMEQELRFGLDLNRLAVLKKRVWANYEQLLRVFFSCFLGQKKLHFFKNIVAFVLKSCIEWSWKKKFPPIETPHRGTYVSIMTLALTTVAKLKGGRRDKSSLLSCRAVERSLNLVGQVVIKSFLKGKVVLEFRLNFICGQSTSLEPQTDSSINTTYQVYCLYNVPAILICA